MATSPPHDYGRHAINYGPYPAFPQAEPRPPRMPPACAKLFEKLQACERRVYPHQSNCFRPRLWFRMCLLKTTQWGADP